MRSALRAVMFAHGAHAARVMPGPAARSRQHAELLARGLEHMTRSALYAKLMPLIERMSTGQ